MADEIKKSEHRFVEAATEAFKRNFLGEYPRLRGYAVEGGKETIALNVVVTCSFDPKNRFVMVESVPHFVPRPTSSQVILV